ncbi:solute carrier family 49 member A3 [Neolamprologus brichardi]|uniref:solute carrier family 49 member A3 n=1 Tax=Neolamprologus brichardi TaxID=32507 RepID=UPI001643D463|nr:solute carrier family 49 member A3 [Neolamprologus brichardi]
MDNSGEVSNDIRTVYAAVSREPNSDLKNGQLFKLYKRRWFVLLVLCLLNCSNATTWLTFAPVANQSAQYLKVTLDEINWLSLVYMVVAIPLSFATTWMLDTLGLRITLILGAWLNMLGAVLRFLGTLPGESFKIQYPIVMLGQTLGALAQPLIVFAPTKLAALWFPDHQRATANMIASMANPLGILLANIISPVMAETSAQIPKLVSLTKKPLVFRKQSSLSAPPTPPSASAETSNSEPFVQGIKLVRKHKAEKHKTEPEDFAGLCGALFIVFGIIGAGILGLYVDKTKKFMEAIKINMSFCAVACIAFSVVQSVVYIVLLQALTTRLADSPLSTCGEAALSWKGRNLRQKLAQGEEAICCNEWR